MSLLCHFAFSVSILRLPEGHCKERLYGKIGPEQVLNRGAKYELDSSY